MRLALPKRLDPDPQDSRSALAVDGHASPDGDVFGEVSTSAVGLLALLHELDPLPGVVADLQSVEAELDVALLGYLDDPVVGGRGGLVAALQPHAEDPAVAAWGLRSARTEFNPKDQ